MSGFELLLDYAQKSRSFAQGLPEINEITQYWTGVGFTLGRHRFVAPMNEVAEILSMPKFTTVPGVKSWVRGVANVRGRLLPVVDMMDFFNRPSVKIESRRRMLVLERDEFYSGILVDDVLGMQHFPIKNYEQDIDDSIDSQMRMHLMGTYSRPSEILADETEYWPIFSLFRLVEDPKFLQVAG